MIPGFDLVGYVPSLDCAMIFANYRSASGESQKSLTCYNFSEHYLYIVDDSGQFNGEHFNTPGHPNGSGAVDPAYNLLMGWSNNSGGRVASFRQQTYWYDFNALAGREKQGEVPQSAGANSLPVAGFDTLRRALVVEGGLSFKGFGEYDPSALTARLMRVCGSTGLTAFSSTAITATLLDRRVQLQLL
jgi:hypothetical protein